LNDLFQANNELLSSDIERSEHDVVMVSSVVKQLFFSRFWVQIVPIPKNIIFARIFIGFLDKNGYGKDIYPLLHGIISLTDAKIEANGD